MIGIRFNGKHSWKDLRITMGTIREIGYPDKIKIIKRPPFSNTDIDFSELYGSQTYQNRKLKYSFNIVDRFGKNTKEAMSTTKTVLVNWLLNSRGKQPLYDDLYPNYYFLAEVEGSTSIEEDWNKGLLIVTFTAYPFMIHELPEGHDKWDDFNFELDVAQQTSFDVNGSLEVVLINNGVPDVVPQIICDTDFTIITDGTAYELSSGTTKDPSFVLKHGENKLTLEGNGHIEFEFYQELI